MKILILTPWRNNWATYMHKYFNSNGHTAVVSNQIIPNELALADVVICGWANEFAAALTDKTFPKYNAKYICYIRSYEIFHGYLNKINWGRFDHMIFVNEDFKPLCRRLFDINKPNVHVIPNGIDLEKWTFQSHQKSNKIAYIADVSFKKGVQLLMQIMLKLPREYELYILGTTPELRLSSYVNHMCIENKLRIYMDKPVEDVAKWLKNKDYILSTSPVEGNPNNVIEAMSLGIKSIIHNWVGARKQFPENLIFNTVEEAVNLIKADDYQSQHYRTWIEEHYDYKKVYKKLEEVIT